MIDKVYDVKNLNITAEAIRFELSGEIIAVPLLETGSTLLPNANSEQLQLIEVDVHGIGIYWPALDEDLSIAGLLRSAGREDLVVESIPSNYLGAEPARESAGVGAEASAHTG